MNEAEIIDILKAGLWLAFSISAPILLITLVVGTVIGLFQALTSVQEMTLTFVPKLFAIFVTFWVTMGFMGGSVVSFYQTQIIELISSPVR